MPIDLELRSARGKRHKARVNAFLAEEKLRRGCARCGYREDPDALELDHINGRGGHAWRASRSWTFSVVRALLADSNIQVLCGNCHNIKSAGERRAKLRALACGETEGCA